MGSLDQNILERAWNGAKDTASTAVRAVSEAYDSVTGKAKTTTNKMAGYVQGDIAIPKAFEDTDGMRPKLKTALKGVIPDDNIEQFLDQDKITSEQVEMILKPALMTKIGTRSQLVVLKNATATHGKLRDLVDRYGFAPIDPDRKVPIPSAAVKSSDLLRELKLKFRANKSEFFNAARETLGLGDPSIDNVIVGRHIVALKAQALIETMDAVMGRTQNSKDGERLKNKGFISTDNSWWGYYARAHWDLPLIGKIGSDKLARAFASTDTDRLKSIGEASMDYSRTELTNDYIMRLVGIAADPKKEELSIFGETHYYAKGDEAQKLMDISDELDVIRQAISSVDPDALRQITDSIDNAIKFTQDVVTPWGIVPIAAIKILTAGGIATPLIASHILHAKYGNGHIVYGSNLFKKMASLLTITGYVSNGAQRAFNMQEASPANTEELKKRQVAHIAPDDAYITTMRGEIEKEQEKCVKETKRLEGEITRLKAIKRPTKRDIATLEQSRTELEVQQKWKSELGRINDLFSQALDEYKRRFEAGTFRKNHDSKNGLQTFFRSITEGKITTLGGVWSDLSDSGRKFSWRVWNEGTRTERAWRRPVEALKRRWFTPGDIVDADVEAKRARKGAKADPLEITLPDGTKKTIRLAEVGYRTPAENLLAEIDLHYRMRKWGSLYTSYKIALGKEAKAEHSKVEARKSAEVAKPSLSTTDHGATHVSYDRSDIAAEVNAAAAKSKPVQDLAVEMSALDLGDKFDPSLLSVKIVDGEPVFDETKIKGVVFDESGKPIVSPGKVEIKRGADGKIEGFAIATRKATLGFLDAAKLKNMSTIELLWTAPIAKGGLGLDKAELPNLKTMSHMKAQEAVVQKVKA